MLTEVETNEPEFQKGLLMYRIYRHVAAILLLLLELIVGKTYGRGWKPYFEYETKHNTHETDTNF